MKRLTGRERYRCVSLSLGGYGRSLSSDHVILELEEQDDDTGDLSWRYATYEDLEPPNATERI
jgi:translation initiation factor IF-1